MPDGWSSARTRTRDPKLRTIANKAGDSFGEMSGKDRDIVDP